MHWEKENHPPFEIFDKGLPLARFSFRQLRHDGSEILKQCY
jgi:hypothetical protein